MNDLAIHLEQVSKRYPHFALEDLTLSLAPGQIMGFIGPNGAGKSTTIRILLGLVHADSGRVHVLGHPVPAEGPAAKREIGYVSEDMRLYAAATLAWHMRFIAGIYPGWDAAYAAELLRRFDLKAEQRLKGMSHGQRVKAALLLALARRPRLLILDEPTTGLDPVARHEVLRELAAVLAEEERTILFSSHNTQDVEQLSDTIAFIDRGKLVALGEKEELLERWRRIRLDVPEGVTLPALPGVVELTRAGRTAVVSIDGFNEGIPHAYQGAGATVLAVTPMSLEEIFVTRVASRREERPS